MACCIVSRKNSISIVSSLFEFHAQTYVALKCGKVPALRDSITYVGPLVKRASLTLTPLAITLKSKQKIPVPKSGTSPFPEVQSTMFLPLRPKRLLIGTNNLPRISSVFLFMMFGDGDKLNDIFISFYELYEKGERESNSYS